MSEFKPLSIEDRPLFCQLVGPENSKNSGHSFGNVFFWDLHCRRNIAPVEQRLCVEYLCRNGIFYAYPAGRGELAPAIELMTQRAAGHGVPLVIRGVTAPAREALEAAFPGQFTFTEDRKNFDYIYSIEALATLAGKKLHGKRNHCNKFQSLHEWSFVPLTPERFDDCMALLARWEEERDGGNPEEHYAIRRAFQHWVALELEGGVLYADGQAVGFTVGERLTEDTVDVHFEKAYDSVQGAYPMVTREFARQIMAAHPEVRYLNREEDMGIENLRKAKESWYPLFLVEKFVARRKETP